MSVLARPGTPISRQCPRANRATSIWFSTSRWPTITLPISPSTWSRAFSKRAMTSCVGAADGAALEIPIGAGGEGGGGAGTGTGVGAGAGNGVGEGVGVGVGMGIGIGGATGDGAGAGGGNGTGFEMGVADKASITGASVMVGRAVPSPPSATGCGRSVSPLSPGGQSRLVGIPASADWSVSVETGSAAGAATSASPASPSSDVKMNSTSPRAKVDPSFNKHERTRRPSTRMPLLLPVSSS